MKPTQEQIQAEVVKLKQIKPKVRHHTAFGDDNHAAIKVQIRVLEKDLSSNAIYDRWVMNDHLCENALYARNWLDGDESEPPSGPNGWGSLVRE